MYIHVGHMYVFSGQMNVHVTAGEIVLIEYILDIPYSV